VRGRRSIMRPCRWLARRVAEEELGFEGEAF